jgi:hypothetical protein
VYIYVYVLLPEGIYSSVTNPGVPVPVPIPVYPSIHPRSPSLSFKIKLSLISIAMAANSSKVAPKFDHEDNNSSGLTWADQWDYNEELNPDGSAKSKSKLGDYNKKMKSAATTGFEKAKSAATVGAKKAKAGTSAGVRWIKIQYNKKKNHTSEHDQENSELNYSRN